MICGFFNAFFFPIHIRLYYKKKLIYLIENNLLKNELLCVSDILP